MEKSPLRVLIVDDEPLIRWSLSETLADHGCRVDEAADAQGALQVLSGGRAPFDVVLLDCHLPDSHDLSLLAAIRRTAPGAAVIVMTAFGTPEMFAEAVELGAYQVLAKPFDVHDMPDLVLQAHASATNRI